MDTTNTSLLIRIKDRCDAEAWSEFHGIYSPLLYRYARSRGISHEDAEDIRSKCYELLVKQAESFDYDKSKGSFKSWLWTMVYRRVVEMLRRQRPVTLDLETLDRIADVNSDQLWNQHWEQEHLRYCFDKARQHVSHQTFEAFRLLVEKGQTVTQVCDSLKMNANQVYKAKSSMLAQVREIMRVSFPDDQDCF